MGYFDGISRNNSSRDLISFSVFFFSSNWSGLSFEMWRLCTTSTMSIGWKSRLLDTPIFLNVASVGLLMLIRVWLVVCISIFSQNPLIAMSLTLGNFGLVNRKVSRRKWDRVTSLKKCIHENVNFVIFVCNMRRAKIYTKKKGVKLSFWNNGCSFEQTINWFWEMC